MSTILIIEDDPVIQRSLDALLRRSGFDTRLWPDLRPAEEALRPAPDMILLDVTLPSGDGFAFCRQLQALSPLPVVFLTVLDDEDSIAEGLESGGDDYVIKPFSGRVLLSRIHAIRRRTARNGRLRSGELVPDLSDHSARLRGEALTLLPKEWEILTLFLRNPGRLLTRRMLLEQLWDAEGCFVDNNTLSVHMSRLRKKLGSFQGAPHIRTAPAGLLFGLPSATGPSVPDRGAGAVLFTDPLCGHDDTGAGTFAVSRLSAEHRTQQLHLPFLSGGVALAAVVGDAGGGRGDRRY